MGKVNIQDVDGWLSGAFRHIRGLFCKAILTEISYLAGTTGVVATGVHQAPSLRLNRDLLLYRCRLPPLSPHPGVFTSPLVTQRIPT